MNHQSTAVSVDHARLAGNAVHAGEILARQDVAIDDIRFTALQSAPEIATIKHLREELHLPGTAVAAPEFQALEKKETSTGWWEPSRAVTH